MTITRRKRIGPRFTGLNAPFGARCFMTDKTVEYTSENTQES